MLRTIGSRRQEALRAFLVERRKALSLTQADVAKRLKQHQSFIARMESGQRRVDVVELLDLAKALGFDPREVIRLLTVTRPD
jgi:transcriptional regulator with XRE-family HTH domain